MLDGLLKRVADAVIWHNFQLIDRNLDALRGVTVSVTWEPNEIGSDKAIQHDLRVVPGSWVMENPDRPGNVWKGNQEATITHLYLLCDTPGLTCTIRIRP